MRSRRVGIVLKTGAGGMWILPQIAALRARSAEVVVVVPDEGGRLTDALAERAREDEGVVIHRTPYRFSLRPSPGNLAALVRFRGELRALQLDAVLYHLYASTLATRFALGGRGVRRVQMVAGPLHLESRAIRAVERLLHRADHAIICGSGAIERIYRGLGAAPHRLRTIPYGVDTAAFRPEGVRARRRARKALGVADDAFLAVMVAFVYAPKGMVHRGRGIKGHEDLLAAWRGFAEDHPEARLVIVGGGFRPEGERYREEIVARAGGDLGAMNVTWLDTVREVGEIYAAADLSVSPSLSENHGAALEASSMAVPSVVSDAGGLPETVSVGETGWIVEAGNPADLRHGLEQAHAAWREGRLRAMGEHARARAVERFDSTASSGRVADVVLEGLG
ncbi:MULTISPECIES: glycosyltransferase family 4 protein [Bacteria]|uniref:glycosyltransferase family 4 protein n=1 Tax=Bacteria TaxID=2 RepID=UPI003C7EA7DD